MGAGSGSTIFLGLPGPRVALVAVLDAGCWRLAAVSASLSSSSPSARVLRLTEVLVDGAARVEDLVAEAAAVPVRVALVFCAVATDFDLAAEAAVPEVALLRGATLDRVTRLGGDAGGSILPGLDVLAEARQCVWMGGLGLVLIRCSGRESGEGSALY